jgi:hypothetical protein
MRADVSPEAPDRDHRTTVAGGAPSVVDRLTAPAVGDPDCMLISSVCRGRAWFRGGFDGRVHRLAQG